MWEQQYSGWEDRCRTLALFDALLSVRSRADFPGVDMQIIGLSVLTFVMDSMIDVRRCSEQDVEEHLAAVVARMNLSMPPEQVRLLRQKAIDSLQNGGKGFHYAYPDLRPGAAPQAQVTGHFHLLDAELDPGVRGPNPPIYLRLTLQGLDLLYRTREFREELGISISQLMFRQQIERGVYDGAMTALRTLRLEVQRRKAYLNDLQRQISRAVDKVKTAHIREMWDRACDLATREAATFAEISSLVTTTREGLQFRVQSVKDQENIAKLWSIERLLGETVLDHSDLIRLAAETAHRHLHALERAIGRALAVTTDLDTEVLERVANGELSPMVAIEAILPLWQPQIGGLFNPMRAFEPQTLGRTVAEVAGEVLEEPDAAAIEALEAERQAVAAQRLAELRRYVGLLLGPLVTREVVSVGEALALADPRERDRGLSDRQFVFLLLFLHQSKQFRFADLLDTDPAVLAQEEPILAALRNWVAAVEPFSDGIAVRAPDDPSDVIELKGGGLVSNLHIYRLIGGGSQGG